MVKSVAQAVPVYSMSCFKLPRGLCEHLNKLIRKFWWGSKNGQRKPHWVSWEEMTTPKTMGGLGFKDFELFNLAMLARQAWRLLQHPESLCARLLKSIYYPQSSILNATLGSHPSQIWRAIVEGWDILNHGLIRRIGDGAHTRILEDPWIPSNPGWKPIVRMPNSGVTLVRELLRQANGIWDEALINNIFLPVDSQAIIQIPV